MQFNLQSSNLQWCGVRGRSWCLPLLLAVLRGQISRSCIALKTLNEKNPFRSSTCMMRAGVRLDILIASSSGMPAFSTMVRNAPSIGAFPSPALVMMLSSNTTVPLSIHPCGVSTLPLMIWVVPPFYCWIFMQRQGWKSIGSQLEGNSNITRRIAQTISCVYLLYIQCLCNWWSCLTQLLHVNLWIDVALPFLYFNIVN